MQALLDAWVVGGSPSRPPSAGAGARRPPSERAPGSAAPRSENWPSDADRRAPSTWLERLSESTLVKDTWLDRNLVKPLSESTSVGSASSTDISGSQTARAHPTAAAPRRTRPERPGPAAGASYGQRSGAITDRSGAAGDRRGGASVPERGGRDLVEHLRQLESSLARDREHGRGAAADHWRTAGRYRDTAGERERPRQRSGDRDRRRAPEASPQPTSSAVLASRLASPRDVWRTDALPYQHSAAYARGSPADRPGEHHARSSSRAGLLASPRAPPGLRAHLVLPCACHNTSRQHTQTPLCLPVLV